MTSKNYVTKGMLNKIIIYLYEHGETTAGDLKENITSNYKDKCEELIYLGVVSIKEGKRGKKKLYHLTDRGEKIGRYLRKANSFFEDGYIECPDCDIKIDQGSKYCKNCGEKLVNS